jgi:hypothetical protein
VVKNLSFSSNSQSVAIPTTSLGQINFNEIYWYRLVNGNLCRPTHLLFDLFRYNIWTDRNKRIVFSIEKIFEAISSILLTIFEIKPGIRRAFLGVPHLANLLQAMG